MKSYLVDSLGVTAPITGSNWFTGPEMIYVQKEMDFIDNHSYWDHPQFPDNPWDRNDWVINNTPMLTADHSTMESHFSGAMVKDKPFTISEYNHAAPNQFQAEMLPLITSYLSFNNADGIMFFTYSGSWDWDKNVVDGYFDIHTNPVLMSAFPLFSHAFRKNLIKPASEVFPVDYSYRDILDMPVGAENPWSFHLPYDKDYGYTTRMELSFDNQADFDPSTLPPAPASPFALPGGEIYWDREGLFTINTPQLASLTGYLGDFSGTATDMMILEEGSDFAGVHWLSLTGQSLDSTERSVLNISTRFMNTGMIWDGTTTVHSNWGSKPVLFCPAEMTLKLKTRFPWLRICRLDENCQVDSSISHLLKTGEDGYASFSFDLHKDRTLWYGIGEGEPSHDASLTGIKVNGVPLVGFHPDTLHYEVELPGDAVELPELSATASHPGATVKISDATEVPGSGSIEVTAQDDTSKINYTVNFSTGVGVGRRYSLPRADLFVSDGQLHLRCDEALVDACLEIFSISGSLLMRREIGSTEESYPTGTGGLFLVRITSADQNLVLNRKLVL